VYWLSRIISAESGGEPLEGKIAVGNVVLNRVKSPDFPNTIYGVIYDTAGGIQFEPVANGTVNNVPDPDSVLAAKLCLDGASVAGGSLFFLNPSLATSFWITENRTKVAAIGSHVFTHKQDNTRR
jgi:N-acetylmuramoyl-L-alanine amidase